VKVVDLSPNENARMGPIRLSEDNAYGYGTTKTPPNPSLRNAIKQCKKPIISTKNPFNKTPTSLHTWESMVRPAKKSLGNL